MADLTFDELLAQSGLVSLSRSQRFREADALRGSRVASTEPRAKPRDVRVAEARVRAEQRRREAAADREVYSTADPAKVRAIEGRGPFRENFKELAEANPEQAAAEVDEIRRTLGIFDIDGPAKAKPERIWKGTHTGADGAEVPYFTNLPAGAMRLEGVRDLHRYEPSAPATTGVGDDSSARRAVGMRLRDAEELVRYTPKTQDVIAREASRHFDSALQDVERLGGEAAAAKWLKMVERGQLSDGAYKRLTAETAQAVSQKDEADYEKVRDATLDLARTDGVVRALDLTRQKRLAAQGNPKHWTRLERELQAKARPTGHADLLLMPDLYLPYSAADAAAINDTQPGTAVDRKAPPTVMNDHGGPSVLDQAEGDADATIARQLGLVTDPATVGRPAKTAKDYVDQSRQEAAIPHPMPPAQRQAQRVGNATLGYEIGGDFIPEKMRAAIPDPEAAFDWLEGGGNRERGRRTRERRKARRDANA